MPADPWPLCFACNEPAVWADQHGAGWCDAHTGRALSAVSRARSVEDFDAGWRWEREHDGPSLPEQPTNTESTESAT